MKTVERPNPDTEAYKQENRLLKNRLKSLLAIQEVHELNKIYKSNGQTNSSEEIFTPIDSNLDFDKPKRVQAGFQHKRGNEIDAQTSPEKQMTPSYHSGLLFKTEETVEPEYQKIDALKSELKKQREQKSG